MQEIRIRIAIGSTIVYRPESEARFLWPCERAPFSSITYAL